MSGNNNYYSSKSTSLKVLETVLSHLNWGAAVGFCTPLTMLPGLSSLVILKLVVFATKQSLPSLSLTVAKRSVENMPFGKLAPRVICHEVSSPSSIFLATKFFLWQPFCNNIEGHQKATFWKSELGALHCVTSKNSGAHNLIVNNHSMSAPWVWDGR